VVQRLLVDAAVPLYAIGSDPAARAPALGVLRAAATGKFEAFASTEMIQEVLHHRLRVTGDRKRAAAESRNVAALMELIAFDRRVLAAAIGLVESDLAIRGRDAVHAATGLVHAIPGIISPDRAFDNVPGLRRWDPTAFLDTLT